MSAEREVRRVDLGSIDNETAKALLAEHRVTINAIARRLFRIARESFVVIPLVDLIDVGRSAVLEAYITHNRERDTSKGGLHSWTERLIRWRMVEAIDELRPEGLTFRGRADSHNGALAYRPSERETPDQTMQRIEVRRWLRQTVGTLPARQSILVLALMHGESLAEAGVSLGISRSRAHQEYQKALITLRRSAAKAGITGLGAVEWLEEPVSR